MRKLFTTLFIFIFLTAAAYAETSVNRISIAKDIQDREPVQTSTAFASDVGKIYCFTEILTNNYPTQVTHIWIYQKDIMSEVHLEVGSPKWRTYSSKTILPEWTGNWKVEVYSKDGKLLDTIDFTINE